jgi:hypothetical protein
MRVRGKWFVAVTLLGVLAGSTPVLADDHVETLRRAVANALQGPIDTALSPAIAVHTVVANAQAGNYEPPAAAALALFGVPWLILMDGILGIVRTWSGGLEMPLGLAVLAASPFTDWRPAPIFPIESTPALVEAPNAVLPIKFGVYYIAGESAAGGGGERTAAR